MNIDRLREWHKFIWVTFLPDNEELRRNLYHPPPENYGADFWRYLNDVAKGLHHQRGIGPVRRKRLADVLRTMGRLRR